LALDEDGGIGKKGGLPWRLSADLKYFKEITWGHYLLMGRVTYQTIGRALPGRRSIILTRNLRFKAKGCLIAGSLREALQMAAGDGEQEAFVIGGGQIFEQALPLADRLYLTRVHAHLDCDIFFPRFILEEWAVRVQSEHPVDEKNDFAFTILLLEKMRKN
jgi:dihydrofolate reductase